MLNSMKAVGIGLLVVAISAGRAVPQAFASAVDPDASPVSGSLQGAHATVDRPAVAPAASRPSAGARAIPPFSDYAVILERKPFGVPPAAPEQAAPAQDAVALQQSQAEQKLAKQINMVAVHKTPAGRVAVGFIDKSEKPERNYYINVGDTVNGYTVVEASFEDETATLQKDEVTITLKLGEGLVKGGGGAAAAPEAPATTHVIEAPPLAPGQPAPMRMTVTLPAPAATIPRTLNSESFRQRLFRQRAEREASAEAQQKQAVLDAQALAEKITKEELEKGKREINLNLIRQGMNPLSQITLTPEEDAEMVKRGVLQD